jgi:CelD/BcsL family acetyltransferase involved in cellulose biosynthesis
VTRKLRAGALDRVGVDVAVLPASHPGLRTVWTDLSSSASQSSPFMTWEWFSALRDRSNAAGEINVFVVRQARHPLGLLALERSVGPGEVRTLGFPGWRWLSPDHNDVLSAPQHRQLVAAAVLHHLEAAGDWDVLDFDGLDNRGGLAQAARALPRWPRAIARAIDPVPCPFVRLASTEPAALLPSRNLRQQVGRGLRQAERQGGAVTVVTDPARLPGALDDLMRLHNQRFGASSSVFATVERRRFHRIAARRLAAVGGARIYRLDVSGGPAALLYALVRGDCLFYYSMGIRHDLGFSPGRTLLGHVVLAAAAEGFAAFDLLRGDHHFKQRFATGVREDVRIRIVRPTPRTAAAAARWVVRRGAAHVRLAGTGRRQQEVPA